MIGELTALPSASTAADSVDDCPSVEPWLAGTGHGVRIGVIDSGWDRSIVDARVAPGVGLLADSDDLELAVTRDDHDRIGHGTSSADLILQIAPNATIVPIRVFGSRLETSLPIIVAALHWAREARLDIVNISLGTRRLDARAPLYRACELARQAGVLLVAAAANDGDGFSYPAVFEPVIGVGKADVSSRFDFVAHPGGAIEFGACATEQRVRGSGGRTWAACGTSVAAPVVTGRVAQLVSQKPGISLEQVRLALCNASSQVRRHSTTS